MQASDLYFMIDKRSGYFLVTKEFWKEHKCISDVNFGEEIWELLPRWTEDSEGFSQEAEGFFKYYRGFNSKYKVGLKILEDLGIEEIHWGEAG